MFLRGVWRILSEGGNGPNHSGVDRRFAQAASISRSELLLLAYFVNHFILAWYCANCLSEAVDIVRQCRTSLLLALKPDGSYSPVLA